MSELLLSLIQAQGHDTPIKAIVRKVRHSQHLNALDKHPSSACGFLNTFSPKSNKVLRNVKRISSLFVLFIQTANLARLRITSMSIFWAPTVKINFVRILMWCESRRNLHDHYSNTKLLNSLLLTQGLPGNLTNERPAALY